MKVAAIQCWPTGLAAAATLRKLAGPLAAATALVLVAPLPRPAAAEGWRSAQPLPPPAPEEQSGVGVPVALGHIGEISFWAPNHGLLITAGTPTIHAGLYYYNGAAWHQLSTVCGGADGRIAWAGPDNFWTISDQQAGQQLGIGSGNVELERQDRSLCHFENGRVVASYAEPIGVQGSYQPMDAAACSEPNDCWFGGGQLAPGVNRGAFHLHWNGSSLTPIPSLETPEPGLEDPANGVADIVFYKGRFYESVGVGLGALGVEAFYLHKLVEGASNPFVALLPEGPLSEHPLQPEEREPFTYSGGGAFDLSADTNQLWAVSNQRSPVALLLGSRGQFQQVRLSGLESEVAALAAEPGTGSAWVSLRGESAIRGVALVARIQADGVLEQEDQLPGAGEGLAAKGSAGAIACPAQGDCWVATGQGWLFHLGGNYPEDNDPSFQSLIDYRPPDASVPFAAPEESFPEDNSGAGVAPVLPAQIEQPSSPVTPRAHKPLFSKVKSRLAGTTLALAFTLATKSHVRLLALRRRRTVAATRRQVLSRGRHTLKLRLSRRAWPTKLDLQVRAIGAVPLQAGEEGTVGGPTVVATSLREPAPAAAQFGPGLVWPVA